jgi:hypothetical protein
VIWVKCRAMKRACLAIACCLCVAADTQPPAVSLQVKTMASKRVAGETWRTDYGSSQLDRSRSMSIEIIARNLRKEPAKLLLEWYFVASAKNKQWIFDDDSEDIEIEGAGTLKLEKESAELEYSKTTLVAIGYARETGGKIVGWIVRLMDGDKVVAVQASTGPLTAIAKDQAKLDALAEVEEP